MRNLMFVTLLWVCMQPLAKAQATRIPAGTLLRCTTEDPNFSPTTVEIGDPVLCHLNQITEFGRSAFPRGSNLAGHLEAAKQPGHFIGKGYLKIVFDRIVLPNADIGLDEKIVAARGQRVDNQGRIVGHGHAKRDIAEWMFPPLWPWKVIMLPARGPQPTLKNEQLIILRLMEDVKMPQVTVFSSSLSPWHHFGDAQTNDTPQSQSYTPPPSVTAAGSSHKPKVFYEPPMTPAMDPLGNAQTVVSTSQSPASVLGHRITLV